MRNFKNMFICTVIMLALLSNYQIITNTKYTNDLKKSNDKIFIEKDTFSFDKDHMLNDHIPHWPPHPF